MALPDRLANVREGAGYRMKISPKINYPVQVVAEPEEHDGPDAELYSGIFLVLLNHEVPIYFVPDVSEIAPPWNGRGLPGAGELPTTHQQARLRVATFGRNTVTPNADRAGTVERFEVSGASGEPLRGVVFYVMPGEFERYTADLAELSELMWEQFPDKTVSDLRGYVVIQFLERHVVASDGLEPYHATQLGRVVAPAGETEPG